MIYELHCESRESVRYQDTECPIGWRYYNRSGAKHLIDVKGLEFED